MAMYIRFAAENEDETNAKVKTLWQTTTASPHRKELPDTVIVDGDDHDDVIAAAKELGLRVVVSGDVID